MQTTPKFKITSLNLLDEYYENPSFYSGVDTEYLFYKKGRKERLIEFLKTYYMSTDIFCFQECNLGMLRDISTVFPDFRFLHMPRRQKDDDGSVIGYRTSLLKYSEMRISPYPGGEHIIFSLCLQDLKNNKFWVVNTHVDFKNRERDLRLLVDYVQTLVGPKIVMGDFNAVATEEWYPYATSKGIDVYRSLNGKHPEWTFDSGIIRRSLDFMFLFEEKNIRVVDCYVGTEKDCNLKGPAPNKDIPTDHISITCSLLIGESRV